MSQILRCTCIVVLCGLPFYTKALESDEVIFQCVHFEGNIETTNAQFLSSDAFGLRALCQATSTCFSGAIPVNLVCNLEAYRERGPNTMAIISETADYVPRNDDPASAICEYVTNRQQLSQTLIITGILTCLTE